MKSIFFTYFAIAYFMNVQLEALSKKNQTSKPKNPLIFESMDHVYLRYYQPTFHSTRNPLELSHDNVQMNYCSFFNNRAPSPQINLKNCTWYKENSCCLQSEIESTFSKVKSLLSLLY